MRIWVRKADCVKARQAMEAGLSIKDGACPVIQALRSLDIPAQDCGYETIYVDGKAYNMNGHNTIRRWLHTNCDNGFYIKIKDLTY